MLNLAIECSGITGSVALYRKITPITQLTLPENMGSVQSLAPAIDSMLSSQPCRRVDLVSVTAGPGSFTGLRAGLATAKMLAFAWHIPVVPVDTLRAIAHRFYRAAVSDPDTPLSQDSSAIVLPVVNAFRRQLFAGAWRIGPNCGPLLLADSQIVDAKQWQADPLGCLTFHPAAPLELPEKRYLCGTALRTYLPTSPGFELAAQSLWEPQAGDVALIGWYEYLNGGSVSPASLTPNYIRASAAEEKVKSQQTAEAS